MPTVSIGLPVYNGEEFLRQALDSILDQTFRDIEVLVYDNASTDGTEQICREYAARDSRITYRRHKTNLGAGPNYNLTFLDSSGKYFKWAAHDDIMAPTFIERCVEVLEAHPDIVIVFPAMVDIDEEGNRLPERYRSHIPRGERGASPTTHLRFKNLIRLDYTVEEIFGLIRSDILGKTRLFLNYADSDRTLLAELALYGRLYELPEVMFFHRLHTQSSVTVYPTREERDAWFDTTLAGKITWPRCRQVKEYAKVLLKHPIGMAERFMCFLFLANYIRRQRRPLYREIVRGAKRWLVRLKPPVTPPSPDARRGNVLG